MLAALSSINCYRKHTRQIAYNRLGITVAASNLLCRRGQERWLRPCALTATLTTSLDCRLIAFHTVP
eukprot:365949-Chlamydomonas_euryale.AAC.10